MTNTVKSIVITIMKHHHQQARKQRRNCAASFTIFLLHLVALPIFTSNVSTAFQHNHPQQQKQQYYHNGFISGGSMSQVLAQAQADLLQQQQQQQQPLPPAIGSPQAPIQLLQQEQPAQQQQQQQQQQRSPNDGEYPPPGPSIYPPTQNRAERDGPIFRLNAQPQNSTTIRLFWSLVSGYHADYFDIKWGAIPDDMQGYQVSKLNGSAREYTFHGLLPETLYQFEITSYHNERPSKPQLAATRTLPASQQQSHKSQQVADIMPMGVKAEGKSNTSIQLSWTEPDRPIQIKNSARVNIIRYYINPTSSQSNAATAAAAAANDSNPTGALSVVPPLPPKYIYLNVTNARESRLIVKNLRPATEYAFAVKTAYYSPDLKKMFMQSGFSMDTLAKTHDIEPSAPRNFTLQPTRPVREDGSPLPAGQHQATDRLELTWLPPESPNGQLKGYLILHSIRRDAADANWSRIEVNGADINNWYVSGIRPGQQYYFKLRAVNQRGQSPDSEMREYEAPSPPPPGKIQINMPIPPNNLLMLVVICMIAVLFLLFLVVSRLACRSRRKPRKGSLNNQKNNMANGLDTSVSGSGNAKLNAFSSVGSSSTVAARVGTLARRRDNAASKPDFWISAMDQQPADVKSNISEKSNSDMNMAMVSIQRDSPQFATTQLAPVLPEYRFATGATQVQSNDHLLQQQQQQQQAMSHYHPGQFAGSLAFDQMDNATASAFMTLSKRQQQQLQKYQIQFATTGVPPPSSMASGMGPPGAQAPSPHQQPPPPPPLNIEQQQQQQQQQSVYGTHQPFHLTNTRSLRLHRPTLYDPVSGAFVQANEGGPPNYNSHQAGHMHNGPMQGGLNSMGPQYNNNNGSNTLQFHPHQTSTLMSRRSTNTLRSFQSSAGTTYGQLVSNNGSQFVPSPLPNSIGVAGQQQQPQLLQSHQAVINQLNNSTYPSLPLKHVSAVVRPQMSSLEDQIEMELAEKEQQQTAIPTTTTQDTSK